jgi:hypothetical protein
MIQESHLERTESKNLKKTFTHSWSLEHYLQETKGGSKPSADEWIMEIWHIHSTEYDSAFKKEICYILYWMNLRTLC